MKAAFLTPVVQRQAEDYWTGRRPWALSGYWGWKSAYDADIIPPQAALKYPELLKPYDLLLMPGMEATWPDIADIASVKPANACLVSWIDYSTELLGRLTLVRHRPWLPAEVANADIVIYSDRQHTMFFPDHPRAYPIIHPIDVKGIRKRHKGKKASDRIRDGFVDKRPVCLWVYHHWDDGIWPRYTTLQHPGYANWAIGLGGDNVREASFWHDRVIGVLPHADFIKVLSEVYCIVNVHPHTSMDRVYYEAGAVGTPVLTIQHEINPASIKNWLTGLLDPDGWAMYRKIAEGAADDLTIETQKARLNEVIQLWQSNVT